MKKPEARRRARLLAVATIALTFWGRAASADDTSVVAAPAGTHVRFHVNEPLSSNASKSGQTFAFTLLDDLRTDRGVVAPAGTQGAGTLLLAGHAGTGGHEGDLTLRIERVDLTSGERVAFIGQRIEINGRNRKVAAGMLGFVPFAGVGARFIRGRESRLAVETPVETVLKQPATYTR